MLNSEEDAFQHVQELQSPYFLMSFLVIVLIQKVVRLERLLITRPKNVNLTAKMLFISMQIRCLVSVLYNANWDGMVIIYLPMMAIVSGNVR